MRAFVVDVQDGRDLRFFVNPEIVKRDGEAEWSEGCLSIPGRAMAVRRSAMIRVKALGYDGEPYEAGFHGLLAAAVQHELDHLDGILAIDREKERESTINRKSKLKTLRRERRAGR
jgi:peptide deformylase